MMAPVLVGLAVSLLAVLAWQSWRARTRLLARLRGEWGHRRNGPRDMDAIADFFRAQNHSGAFLDDRTWNDLLMDDVFSYLDRTESSVGQQMLYYRLRCASAPQKLNAFDALVTFLSGDAPQRERAQVALARLRSLSGHYVHRLARPNTLDRPRWHVVLPLWTVGVMVTMSLAFFMPGLLFLAAVCYLVNFAIRIATSRSAVGKIAWFRQVGPLLSAASVLAALGTDKTEEITGSLRPNLTALKRLGSVVRWVSRDPLAMDDISFFILEFLNVLFLLDANALYFATGELQLRAPHLLEVIETVGEIDAAIAIASFRVGFSGWMRPRFASPEGPAIFADLRHPLVDQAVPNSIALAPPHGVLVTGSNMSGKSTFLRTVGINVVLAQTINTCLASAYEAPVYHLRSCIRTR